MVLQEMAQVLQRRVLPDTGRFHGTPRKVPEEGVEERKDSDMETKDSDSENNNKNRKRKVCVCGFDSEQCEHVVSV